MFSKTVLGALKNRDIEIEVKKMEKVKIYLILIVTFIFAGCDPAFKHEFKGRILSEENNEPLEGAKSEYSFYPVENLYHWRANDTERDSVKITDKNGEFIIDFSTVTITFDSLEVKINKEGYKQKVLISTKEEWKSRRKLNQTDFRFDFGQVELERI